MHTVETDGRLVSKSVLRTVQGQLSIATDPIFIPACSELFDIVRFRHFVIFQNVKPSRCVCRPCRRVDLRVAIGRVNIVRPYDKDDVEHRCALRVFFQYMLR